MKKGIYEQFKDTMCKAIAKEMDTKLANTTLSELIKGYIDNIEWQERVKRVFDYMDKNEHNFVGDGDLHEYFDDIRLLLGAIPIDAEKRHFNHL